MEENMANPSDDLEAVRIIVATLEGFGEEDQERILRWAREKLGLLTSVVQHHPTTAPKATLASPEESANKTKIFDIGTFVKSKNPANDVQFAATVAYYFRFEAPENEQKENIDGTDLQEACRKANRTRLNDPATTLNNAYKLGLLDKGAERGKYSINSVGENLVAMTLPQQSTTSSHPKKQKNKKVNKKSK
jgi:hypothetical protein